MMSTVISVTGNAAGEALKRKVLGWALPCKTYVIIKLILTSTIVIDLSSKMTLIAVVLLEVLRQKQANRKKGFCFADLHSIAKRMVICMAFALVNDLSFLGVALMPLLKNKKLQVELMPTVSCINSLINLIILIISFPTWKNRFIPWKMNSPLRDTCSIRTITAKHQPSTGAVTRKYIRKVATARKDQKKLKLRKRAAANKTSKF